MFAALACWLDGGMEGWRDGWLAHQLIGVLGPGQVAHLGPRVDALQGLAG